ncbi:MAG: hypothetical protein JSW20_13405 [Nitrospiraceae bacterium]|nr:MAG: hypothetical protein JSW20_13405 [Nitrospiraceae bacterium]
MKFFWLSLFAISMAFVESAVVVYLRAIYYPEGFSFPLKPLTDYKIFVEVCREIATILMLMTVAHISGRKFWERFAYLIFIFGVWDIFYYVWLKVLLKWPASLFEWDVLFLIPLPWIGPVIAPVSISIIMIVCSILIIRYIHRGHEFRPAPLAFAIAIAATCIILYSFMYDTGATLRQQMPAPYKYGLLIAGDFLYIVAFLISYKRIKDPGGLGFK